MARLTCLIQKRQIRARLVSRNPMDINSRMLYSTLSSPSHTQLSSMDTEKALLISTVIPMRGMIPLLFISHDSLSLLELSKVSVFQYL